MLVYLIQPESLCTYFKTLEVAPTISQLSDTALFVVSCSHVPALSAKVLDPGTQVDMGAKAAVHGAEKRIPGDGTVQDAMREGDMEAALRVVRPRIRAKARPKFVPE
jgi:hypothetical protein